MRVTAAAWVATVALIAGLLTLVWLLLGHRPHRVALGEAIRWSVLYIAVAVLFGLGIGLIAGWDLGTQYFAGYVVEKSLPVDNLFVFVIIISGFAVPTEQQPKALTLGITIAFGLRTRRTLDKPLTRMIILGTLVECLWKFGRGCDPDGKGSFDR